MQFGLCGGEAAIGTAKECGFDYIELPVATCLNPETQDVDTFARLKRSLIDHDIPATAFNLLLPGDLCCVGPAIDRVRLDRYFSGVMSRAFELGGQTVVFGSGGQRAVPQGFEEDLAHEQLLDAFLLAADHAGKCGLVVAIEPLNRAETNQVISVAEAAAIARSLNHPALRVLSDLYHVVQDGQTFSETADAGDLLVHIHVAGKDRRAPMADDLAVMTKYFQAVKTAGFVSHVSIEAQWNGGHPQAAQASIALDSLRQAWLQA